MVMLTTATRMVNPQVNCLRWITMTARSPGWKMQLEDAGLKGGTTNQSDMEQRRKIRSLGRDTIHLGADNGQDKLTASSERGVFRHPVDGFIKATGVGAELS